MIAWHSSWSFPRKERLTLKEMKIPDSRAAEILRKINDKVAWDLANNVWNSIPREVFAANRQDPTSVRKQLTDTLLQSPTGHAQQNVKTYLGGFGAWTDKVEQEVIRFEEFRRTGQLAERSK